MSSLLVNCVADLLFFNPRDFKCSALKARMDSQIKNVSEFNLKNTTLPF